VDAERVKVKVRVARGPSIDIRRLLATMPRQRRASLAHDQLLRPLDRFAALPATADLATRAASPLFTLAAAAFIFGVAADFDFTPAGVAFPGVFAAGFAFGLAPGCFRSAAAISRLACSQCR
jgi:hypothetical protein